MSLGYVPLANCAFISSTPCFLAQVPTSYSEVLARLQGRAFDQCFSLTVKQSSVFGNEAYHAGGERGLERG